MTPSRRAPPCLKITLLTAAIVLSGCASTNNPRDPLEGFNRTVFNFNDKVDQVALKPAAKAYRAVLPTFVQIGVGNFFGNLGDVWTGVNNVLQGKVGDGLSDFMRFAVNSTIGLGGLLDISSEAGIPKHKEDFGQTLGRWGVASGPYVVLPLLGSSTIRDTAALPLDYKGDLWSYVDPVRVRNTGTVIRIIDARASVLDATDLIEGAALDRYEFVRDAYLQRRESRINDGKSSDDDSSRRTPSQNGDTTIPGGTAPAPGPSPVTAPSDSMSDKPILPTSAIGESPLPIMSSDVDRPRIDSGVVAETSSSAVVLPLEAKVSLPIEDCGKALSVEARLSCLKPAQ
jgi:phospholipid-binding lipoprotein MlaA